MKTYLKDKKTGEYYLKVDTFFDNVGWWFRMRWYNIRHFYYDIRHLYYNFRRKESRDVILSAIKGYPFDFGYLNELEYYKLKELLVDQERYLNRKRKWAEEEEDEKKKKEIIGTTEANVRYLRICISLLEIIMGERNTFTYVSNDPDNDDGMTFYETDRTDEKGGRYYKMEMNNVYKCLVNVNMKNMDRFAEEKYKEFYTKSPHEFYELKAKYIYHKIRAWQTDYWWT